MRSSPLYVASIAVALSLLALDACSDDPTTGTPDGGTDSATTKDGGEDRADGGEIDSDVPDQDSGTSNDGSCVGPIVTTSGETCTGFGTQGGTCDPACGQPYGYLCINGAPPSLTGCREQRVSAFGNTYCCSKNACVERPDRAIDCAAVAGKPKHFQCPPLEGDAGNVAPPVGCVETGSGATNLEKYYCCP